jgi:hypothetical protein
LAGDLRSICVQKHCVVHGGVTFLWKMPLGPIVRFKPISNSQWSLITLRAMQAASLVPCEFRVFVQFQFVCTASGNTLCFAMILVPCTFKCVDLHLVEADRR